MPRTATRKSAAKKSRYSPHPALAKEEAYTEKFAEKTGRPLAHWVALAKKSGTREQRDCAAWLRREHGLGQMDAWWVAAAAVDPEYRTAYDDPETLVDALYSGRSAALRPLHEKLVDAALACGDDVIATSCKTMVPLYRRHVFAELKPVEGGVEVQLALGEDPSDARFVAAGRQPGDRLTHRMVVRSEADLDARFAACLRTAYEHGAGKMKRAASARTPSDLARALRSSPKAAATWNACTSAMQRDWILWIESAKQAETRARRVGQAVAKLEAGKKKMY